MANLKSLLALLVGVLLLFVSTGAAIKLIALYLLLTGVLQLLAVPTPAVLMPESDDPFHTTPTPFSRRPAKTRTLKRAADSDSTDSDEE